MGLNIMDQDAITAMVIFIGVFVCGGIAIVAGQWCPRTRPRRISGYIDDEVNLV
jgi:hypothetical protein